MQCRRADGTWANAWLVASHYDAGVTPCVTNQEHGQPVESARKVAMGQIRPVPPTSCASAARLEAGTRAAVWSERAAAAAAMHAAPCASAAAFCGARAVMGAVRSVRVEKAAEAVERWYAVREDLPECTVCQRPGRWVCGGCGFGSCFRDNTKIPGRVNHPRYRNADGWGRSEVRVRDGTGPSSLSGGGSWSSVSCQGKGLLGKLRTAEPAGLDTG